MTRIIPTARATLDPSTIVTKYLPDQGPLENIYKDLHAHPELGRTEHRTSTLIKKQLLSLGFEEVHTGIGGTGVVGVLRNGAGKTVLLRADMDGLPIEEQSGVPYASRRRQPNSAGEDSPTMHACGHDFHVTALLGTAALLKAASQHWSGTLVCLFQPDEEGGSGAQAMVDDGLYDTIKVVPDLVLGQHVNYMRAGEFYLRAGPSLAAADSYRVTIFGRGGHGSVPHMCIDPIVIASTIVVRLQTIVSRMVSPLDTAVVTCGSFHGGNAENVIPDEVVIKVNLRSYSDETRDKINKAVKSIIKAECESAGVPKEPLIERISQFPVTDNSPEVVEQVRRALQAHFGDAVHDTEKISGSEDFSNLARSLNIPYAMWFWGGTDHKTWDEAEKKGNFDDIPKNHTARFAPAIQPTLQSGMQGFSLAALQFLRK